MNGACLLWLERIRPLFFSIAVGALIYEIFLLKHRPRGLRQRGAKAMLALSVAVNAIIIGGWIWLTYRYG